MASPAVMVARLAADGISVTTFDIADGADVGVDIADSSAVEVVAQQVGPIDVLVNSAGH